jgi:hypothetical protein
MAWAATEWVLTWTMHASRPELFDRLWHSRRSCFFDLRQRGQSTNREHGLADWAFAVDELLELAVVHLFETADPTALAFEPIVLGKVIPTEYPARAGVCEWLTLRAHDPRPAAVRSVEVANHVCHFIVPRSP